jgi:pyrimidine-nucleoside phosphorylase
MRDSGTVLDLSRLGATVDKHSTGGIGDKTSLILAPLVAAAGVPVPMMAGRGLGHTGGTLDKLESVSGFNVRLELEAFERQVSQLGCAIIGQTQEMCPADRKLYALRDVTGTIDSLPLICGSIMSKKLAEGMSALVLDVKFGSGAFMKTLEDAERLAGALMAIGRHAGKRVSALLTNMQAPLGRFVGNALEVRECLDIMDAKTEGFEDTVELTLALAGHMIFLGGKAPSVEAATELARKLLGDGSAKRKFVDMCRAQGGDLSRGLPQAPLQETLTSPSDGFLHFVDLEKLGNACVLLGAGRRFQTDKVDPSAGLELLVREGDAVKKGASLITIHYSDKTALPAAMTLLKQSFELRPRREPTLPLIAKVLS